MPKTPWIQIDINPDGDRLRVGLQSSAGQRPGTRGLDGVTRASLAALGLRVQKAAARGEKLADETREALTRLTTELFTTAVVTDKVLPDGLDPAGGRVLLRIAASEPELQAFPWEALRTQDGFLTGSTRLGMVRLPRVGEATNQFDVEVEGALRVLAVAPIQSTQAALGGLRAALGGAIERGEVDWLVPIVDVESAAAFHERLKQAAVRKPHVLHFMGHGESGSGQMPRLQISDGTWLDIEALARQIQQDFREVRLVVLEACRGAEPGAFASAAEHLCRAGVEAVLAFLWPVDEASAEDFVSAFYAALTGEGAAKGDVVASVEAAREPRLGTSASAFTAVLYLRGEDGRLFDFRKPRTQAAAAAGPALRGLDPPLAQLLAGPFSLVLGSAGSQAEIFLLLREEVTRCLREAGDTALEGVSWSALVDRYVWIFGAENLHQLCQQALREAAQAALEKTGGGGAESALVRALGRRLPAGVHVTLLWQPVLERMAARSAGSRAVYTVQPSIRSVKDAPAVFVRDPARGRWSFAKVPERIEPEDVSVLRLLGGVMATDTFSSPVLTDDDHLLGVFVSPAFRPPWMNPYLASLRGRRTLFVGLSALDWHHRLLLRWLFDRSLPDESVVILPPEAERAERLAWEERGAGLGGEGRVYAVQRSEGELARLLESESR